MDTNFINCFNFNSVRPATLLSAIRRTKCAEAKIPSCLQTRVEEENALCLLLPYASMQPPNSSPVTTSYPPTISHSVPFGQSHNAAPGSLGYGFGMSAATRFSSPSASNPINPGGWRGGLSWGGAGATGAGGAGPSGISVGRGITTPETAASRRRRRSLSEDSEEDHRAVERREIVGRSGKKARFGGSVPLAGAEELKLDLGKAIGMSSHSLASSNEN